MSGPERILVAQLGGPTAVSNSTLAGLVRAGDQTNSVGRVLGARNGVTGLIAGTVIDLTAESERTVEQLPETPGAALGSSRRQVGDGDFARIERTLDRYDVTGCVLAGGNGTMQLTAELDRRIDGVDVLGVPNTVDNDVEGTDYCPGFPSAARYYAVTVREVGRDVATLPPPVTVFETMGRDAGWLAAATALAGPEPDEPPHLVYPPESPFDTGSFLDAVQRIYDRLGYVLVVVAEGLRDDSGDPVAMATDAVRRDATGKPLLGGVAERLSTLVGDELDLRARSERPGLCGRASVAHQSRLDRKLARQLGRAAVDRLAAGESGVMVALRRQDGETPEWSVESVSLSEVSGTRSVPDEYLAVDGPDVTEAFHRYADPLLGGPLPEHAVLAGVSASSEDV